MTRLPRLLLAASWLLLAPMPAPAAATLETVLEALRRPPPASETFHEIRYRRALKAPLVARGTLTWSGGFAFERDVDSPYRESARLDGRMLVVRRERGPERLIPLARAPELEAVFAGLSAVFAGDADALERAFDVAVEGDARWRLRLAPRDARLRARVEALELLGEGAVARCLLLRQENAPTLTVFGADEVSTSGADLDTLVRRHCSAP